MCPWTLHLHAPYLDFLDAIEKAPAVRTLESLARIELGAQGGALLERVTTTRTAKNGTATTTVRERYTPPDWRADGWFLERRHPADWSRRTELVLPDHHQAKEADPLVGVHDELRLARLSRQKRLGLKGPCVGTVRPERVPYLGTSPFFPLFTVDIGSRGGMRTQSVNQGTYLQTYLDL